LLCLAGVCFAQNSAVIHVSVLNSQRQPVAGATVELFGVKPQPPAPNGDAFFTGLKPGNYRLSITKSGYQKVEVLNISAP
jgi:hypothetical protein